MMVKEVTVKIKITDEEELALFDSRDPRLTLEQILGIGLRHFVIEELQDYHEMLQDIKDQHAGDKRLSSDMGD